VQEQKGEKLMAGIDEKPDATNKQPENIVPLKGHGGFSLKAQHGMASQVKAMKPKARPQTGHEVMKNLTANLPKVATPVDPVWVN
jgi:hypothetical protein